MVSRFSIARAVTIASLGAIGFTPFNALALQVACSLHDNQGRLIEKIPDDVCVSGGNCCDNGYWVSDGVTVGETKIVIEAQQFQTNGPSGEQRAPISLRPVPTTAQYSGGAITPMMVFPKPLPRSMVPK